VRVGGGSKENEEEGVDTPQNKTFLTSFLSVVLFIYKHTTEALDVGCFS
jgi:hypothetical protein